MLHKELLDRIAVTKQLFHAFANRSMAYQTGVVIGLTQYGERPSRVVALTELFEHFKTHIDDAEAWEDGTHIYDAMEMALAELQSFGAKYP